MNLGVPASEFKGLPSGQVYIYQGTVPGPLESEAVQSPFGTVPESFKHQLLAQKPTGTAGGSIRIADTSNFPVAKTAAAALVEIKPGAMREIHWHNNNDEFQYYLTGQGRMTVFGKTAERVLSITGRETWVMYRLATCTMFKIPGMRRCGF